MHTSKVRCDDELKNFAKFFGKIYEVRSGGGRKRQERGESARTAMAAYNIRVDWTVSGSVSLLAIPTV
jgi:hypothetical protein